MVDLLRICIVGIVGALAHPTVAATVAPPPRVAVFGGSGYIGRRVCKTLVDSGCDVVSLDECDEKQKKFIEKMKAKSAGEKAPIKKEMTRLEGMKGNKMAPENTDWLVQRLGLLKRMHEEL